MKLAGWVVAACAAFSLAACNRNDAPEPSAPPTEGVTDAMLLPVYRCLSADELGRLTLGLRSL